MNLASVVIEDGTIKQPDKITRQTMLGMRRLREFEVQR